MDQSNLPIDDAAASGVLYDLGDALPKVKQASGTPRLRYANRAQASFRMCSLENMVAEDHPVRMVWAYVQKLNLDELLAQIKSTPGRAGAPAADPRILLALWLYATLRGIGSARELERRCLEDLPFCWLCGEVSMNHHTLSDFRGGHVELLDRLLTDSVAVLMHEGLVSMERVAQDGMKVRANAGAGSFRRRPRLQEYHQQAKLQVEALKKELEGDPGASTRRQQAARQRAAQERAERLQRALEQLPQVERRSRQAGPDGSAAPGAIRLWTTARWECSWPM